MIVDPGSPPHTGLGCQPTRPVEAIEARDRRPRREAQIDALLAAVLVGDSVTDAAAKAGMSRASAYEEMRRRDVQDRLAEARADMLRQSAAKAASLVTEAIDVLADLARNAVSESVKRQAASDLLGHSRALRVDADVDARMNDIAGELDALLGGGVG